MLRNTYKFLLFRDKSDGKRNRIKPPSDRSPGFPWVPATCQTGQRIRCSLIPPAPRYVLLPFWQFPLGFINDRCKVNPVGQWGKILVMAMGFVDHLGPSRAKYD